MAKRKHSAALFEVVNRSRSLGRPSRPGLMRSVSSWFRKSDPIEPAANPPSEQLLIAEPPPATPAPSPVEAFNEPNQPDNSASIDADRRELYLRVTYSSALVAGFALMTLLGIAFIIGRKTTPTVRPALTSPSDELRNSDITLGATDLTGTADNEAGATFGGMSPAPKAATPATQPVQRDRRRDPAMNYVLIQSYPSAEEKMAHEAVELLRKNNIDCTIEYDIPGWKGKHVVVGTLGFNRISANPELDAYIRKIKQISDSNTKRNSFKAFVPMAFRWGNAKG